MPCSKRVIYLHGFLSSPQSDKAQILQSYLQQHAPDVVFFAPDVAVAPDQAMKNILECVKTDQGSYQDVIVGSSLGGFYATYVSQLFDMRAVLLNPALQPWLSIPNYLGMHQILSGSKMGQWVEVTQDYAHELEKLAVTSLDNPKNFLVLLTTGDEVIPYVHAQAFYANSRLKIIEGSDHQITEFANYVPEIVNFIVNA